MECRVAATFDWEWGPSTLQRLGKAQVLRVYIYIYRDFLSSSIHYLDIILDYLYPSIHDYP